MTDSDQPEVQCIDVEHRPWQDDEGDRCADYERKQYCTPDGKEGPGWNLESWGGLSENRNTVSELSAIEVSDSVMNIS